jgi:peptidoglycan hydrolase-like protein with peptidoglycan-binding domain
MARFEDSLPYFAFGGRTLRLTRPHTVGTDVKVLQTIFNEMLAIMNPPEGPMGDPIIIDGILGPQTEQAIFDVQSYFGLAVDGIVGPQTFLAFGQAVGSNVSKGYGGPAFGSRTLSEGVIGGDVTVLQNRLNCFRYQSILNKVADGAFNAATTAAVKAFQADAVTNGDTGLVGDGVVGPETFDALWIYTYAGGRNLAQGDKGFDVVWVQFFLAGKIGSDGLAYYPGHIDGYYGPLTQEAVRKWRTDNLLPTLLVNVDPAVYQSIGFNNPNKAPFPAPVPVF